MIRRQIRSAISMTIALMFITGLMYPLIMTGIAQLLFPRQANGSLVTRDGRVVGSSLIGQQFSEPQYFHPRPSAAGAGYDPLSSGGTNKGPTDRKLADTLIAAAVDSAVVQDQARRGAIPADLVTSSASGLDPDISPASAAVQIARVARARNADSTTVAAIVARHVQLRQLGILGEPRVNVLALNLALDAAFNRR
jgi:potassium-transporting ATPase KdpC subunit